MTELSSSNAVECGSEPARDGCLKSNAYLKGGLTMHTAIIIFFGLVLLALMLFIGEKIGFPRQTLAYSFIVLWLALTLINGAVGMVNAGQPLSTELVVGSAVFGVPVAALVLFMVLSTDT
jgi:hypothetical protein